ncbi:MAG: hypothetical protein EHM24_11850 [Acidobacteria bacterium]|nr:MAG: hypothetical protein EHM24_11850 [Acidobacteriota bacterium]
MTSTGQLAPFGVRTSGCSDEAFGVTRVGEGSIYEELARRRRRAQIAARHAVEDGHSGSGQVQDLPLTA